jgi:hypothetical protein
VVNEDIDYDTGEGGWQWSRLKKSVKLVWEASTEQAGQAWSNGVPKANLGGFKLKN